MESKDEYLVLAFFAWTVSIVGLAVAGGFRAYSPVPFGDMWGGHLTFVLKATERYTPALMGVGSFAGVVRTIPSWLRSLSGDSKMVLPVAADHRLLLAL